MNFWGPVEMLTRLILKELTRRLLYTPILIKEVPMKSSKLYSKHIIFLETIRRDRRTIG
jgi:hypothetical protein